MKNICGNCERWKQSEVPWLADMGKCHKLSDVSENPLYFIDSEGFTSHDVAGVMTHSFFGCVHFKKRLNKINEKKT